jgi:hypothetical protein
MTVLPEAKVIVRRMGREGEPLVVIDGFSGMVDALLEAAYDAPYQDAGAYYPGIRAPADPSYLNQRQDLLIEVMREIFGFSKAISVESSSYSIVTLGGEALSPPQRIPHFDHAGGEIIAVMHYLLGPETGGTAFYRHRATGYEAITPQRLPAYTDALAEEELRYGSAPFGYCYGDSDRFELIDEIEAKPDRLVLYRGRQLHSGVIPNPAGLSSDPRKGRLTINMFLEGA